MSRSGTVAPILRAAVSGSRAWRPGILVGGIPGSYFNSRVTLPTQPPAASDPPPPPNFAAIIRRALLWIFVPPVVVFVLYALAPWWLDHRIHSELIERTESARDLSPTTRAKRLAFFANIDFAAVCRGERPDLKDLRARLEAAGVSARFQRLFWARNLAAVLLGILLTVTAGTALLAQQARKSQAALIRSYRAGWVLAMSGGLANVFLLIPLLAYGFYEIPVLLADRFPPMAIVAVVLGGLGALWASVRILLRKIPLEFTEPMAREVTPEEAPELWQTVKMAAERVGTAPPDRILIGMKLNFYVTELAVRHDSGRVEGRTLFLSLPGLRQLELEEVLSVIGHELGHFVGEDTRTTREFYPLTLKTNATMFILARSGWVGWSGLFSLSFFSSCFGAVVQAVSRHREFEADRVAAALTTPATAGRALLKIHVLNEAFRLGVGGTGAQRLQAPFDTPMAGYIREHLAWKTDFWTRLFEQRAPHPLDSHPPLRERLDALGCSVSTDEAVALAGQNVASAYSCWFAGRDSLFAGVLERATGEVNQIRHRADVAQADYQTENGRVLLEQAFPERRWRRRPAALWVRLVPLGLVAGGLFLGAVFVPDLAGRLILGGVALLPASVSTVLWRRHRRGELLLRADRIHYSGWDRPLLFADVRLMKAHNHSGSLSAIFLLKERSQPYWKLSLVRSRRASVTLSLDWIAAKQPDVLQNIYRYLNRQVEKPQ